ncbi:chemotaxis protein MotB [Parasaccharibacter sp. TMW2.1882]|uniref:Chemotaxis protein MotB n=2 Tax=Acetobacterales TaxID=3120395 RepID=A0ABX4ZLP9_9PROT|nr:chemotaxis protein MotB [Parasaccharibacter sp. TMW2.1885]MCL1497214.1 chemotaxis protein MotB [Parasaccharibacter sp. TMW2.1882]MCL1512143.1 chemotaxis protein MotB [Parasaccharibacter sp. TMW 2.1884]MCL1515482.1 chemotaxis protein MotB [Parasaccharibacter sp. TMW2.1890]POS62020.1 chemotaxis protein MotB [Parasaccharibacter apium]
MARGRGGAAMADRKNARPIIIKREEVVEAGHHGGAWKVAYADFMTAMMAFFLLMWLLNITTDEQKRGIALFFNPMADRTGKATSDQALLETSPLSAPSSLRTVHNSDHEPPPKPDSSETHPEDQGSRGGRASEGILTASGVSILPPGMADRPDEDEASVGRPEIIPLGGPKSGAAENVGQVGQGNAAADGSAGGPASAAQSTGASADHESSHEAGTEGVAAGLHQAAQEDAHLRQTVEGLKASLAHQAGLNELKDNLGFRMGADEIRIEVQDTAHRPMFDNGETMPNREGMALLGQIGSWLGSLPEDISIIGETDGVPYHLRQVNPHGLSNWTLSEMRADRVRELLVRAGYPDRRIRSVEGRADRSLANPAHPEAPENRRIVLLIHRLHPLPASFQAGTQQAPPQGAAR